MHKQVSTTSCPSVYYTYSSMCSMLLRLVSALLTLLFVGSVHLYIMWETVRRPYVLVAMSAPQTVAHFCTWQRKWLCYWKRASAASLLWLCGILNQKGWWKCSPTFFRGPIATTRVFQGHRFPPLITSTYTHTHVCDAGCQRSDCTVPMTAKQQEW